MSEIMLLTATIDMVLQEMDLTQTPASPYNKAVQMISILPCVFSFF